LVGDIFDFWFEFKHVVPKGFVRLLAKLRELSDSGIIINYFTGNHDMWIFGYIPEITKANIINSPQIRHINGKKFFIAHGDALGHYDIKQNILNKMFKSHFFQFLFKLLHPSISFRIAKALANSSRKKHKYPENIDPNYEWLIRFSNSKLKKEHFDFFIFGHRHLAFQMELKNGALFTNLGDWISNFTFAVFDGEQVELLNYKEELHLIE
jgi:UDP-2,3-diacylglucosamine hydrolase